MTRTSCKLSALLIFLLAGNFACAQRQNQQVSAIAFYNLENLFDPADNPTKYDEDFTPGGLNKYTEEVYRKKLHNMAFALSQLATDKIPDGPALIGLAEVENEKVLKDLAAEPALKNRQYRIVHFESPDSRGIDVGLLYHVRLFKVINARALPVDIRNGSGKERTRDVLYVKGIMGKDTMHVFVNHWPSRLEGSDNSEWKRMQAAAVNRKMIDAILLANPKAKIVVMGDMNDDPSDKSIAEGLKATEDKNEQQPGNLYNPWLNLHKKGAGTLVYKNSWNLFDQIIISYGLVNAQPATWQYRQQEIFNRKFLQYPFGKKKGSPHRSFSGNRWVDGFSDHFPVIIYLSREQ